MDIKIIAAIVWFAGEALLYFLFYRLGYHDGQKPTGVPKMENPPPPPIKPMPYLKDIADSLTPGDGSYVTVFKSAACGPTTSSPLSDYLYVPAYMVRECYLPKGSWMPDKNYPDINTNDKRNVI